MAAAFKANYAKGFPDLSKADLKHCQDNLEMPPIIVPGVNKQNQKNRKHKCFNSKLNKERLKGKYVEDFKDLEEGKDQPQASDSDSKLPNDDNSSFEKERIKVKTNFEDLSPRDSKEEEIDEMKNKRLKKEEGDSQEEWTFPKGADSIPEVASSN